MPESDADQRIRDLEQRVSTLEAKLLEADEALSSFLQTDLELFVQIEALIHTLEQAGILREDQMSEELNRTRQAMTELLKLSGRQLLAFLLKPNEDLGKPQ